MYDKLECVRNDVT